MSPLPKAILLPKLVPFDLVGLGYLLPKPLNPSINPRPVSVHDEECTKPYIEADYKTTACIGVDGSLRASLSSLFGLEFGAKWSNMIQIEAEEMMFQTLKNPDATFSTICDDNSTREWINNMHRHGKKIHFVVGLQSLREAHIQREVLSNIGGGLEASVPTSSPVDIQLKAALWHEGAGTTESRVSGVFGIEVRKVKWAVKKETEPTLDDECSWRYTVERVKGAGEPTPKKICVSLGNFVDENEFVEEQDSENEDEDEDED